MEGVEVSAVDLKGPTGQGQSRDPCLQVRLALKNLSKTKLIHVRGWGANEFFLGGRPELTDNFDNSYRGVGFGIFDHPAGQIVGGADVRPGEQETDVLVFDRPVDGVKYLRLTLPAENFGQEGSLRFQIPAGMIRR